MQTNKKAMLSPLTESRLKYIPKATKHEINAALKLVELLHLQGEIPQHVYRNICNDYYGKGIDIVQNAWYTVTTPRLDAVI